jgi:hypothetical protein
MMRKDVSGGQRSKFKKSEKMMGKDFQEVERSKLFYQNFFLPNGTIFFLVKQGMWWCSGLERRF